MRNFCRGTVGQDPTLEYRLVGGRLVRVCETQCPYYLGLLGSQLFPNLFDVQPLTLFMQCLGDEVSNFLMVLLSKTEVVFNPLVMEFVRGVVVVTLA